MLTENEIQWLEDRETQAKRDKGQYYCWYCKHHGYCDPLTLCPTGSSESFYRDAAEFEARCAEILSVIPECRDNCTYETISHDMCRRCRIKRARIAAESEMG